MKWFEGITVRSVLFGIGAIGAAAEALNIAQRDNIQITPAHVISLVCTALVAYAMKWPTDVTKAESQRREARARRESIMPPPGDDPARQIIDGLGIDHPGVRPATDEQRERKLRGPS